ncbi:hypothetical protein BX667DRAFT_497769 [Coemansia mojavensis]|nr:hypothetical protein BX667DRAFT_497769 [Coemansia mojavensis]
MLQTAYSYFSLESKDTSYQPNCSFAIRKIKRDWNVECLDTHESGGTIGRLYEDIYESLPEWIESLVTKSKFDLMPLLIKPFGKPEILSSLEKLALGMIGKMFSFVLRTAIIFCLALACYRFLEIGRLVFSKKKKYTCSWAGKRIICAGDYAEYSNVLTKKEMVIMSDKSLYDCAEDFGNTTIFDERAVYAFVKLVNCAIYYKAKYTNLYNFLPISSPTSMDGG